MANRLKIGLVLDTSLDQPDGVQQYVLAIGEWLRSRSHDVHYLVGQSSRDDVKNVHSLARNTKVRFNGNRTTIPLPTNKYKLRKFLQEHQFDVLHVQMPHSPFMAQRLVLQATESTAIVGTFHIAPYNRAVKVGNRALGIWLRPSLKRFDKIVSVSPAAKDFAKSSFGIHTDVLPNVIDYQRFNKAKPLSKFDKGTLNILFLGRLVPRKGCEVLLDAINILSKRKNIPKHRLIICGKGPQMSKYKKFVKKNSLDEIVSFEGFIDEDNKPSYYASADLSVFPSSGGESFGIVLLEAMASGKSAVLAGDNPGYRSVMAPRPKQLFDPYNIHGLADLLSQYLRHGNVRKDAQEWGESYAKKFDIGVVGKKLEDIYLEALRKHRRT